MEFIIKRTSQWDDDIPPIKGARIKEVRKYDYRIAGITRNELLWNEFNNQCTDIERLPNGDWRGKRKEKTKVWIIDINDIMEFVKKVDEQCILTATGIITEDYPVIEIYDDYRE